MRADRSSHLPLPPFGREVLQTRVGGEVNLFVFAGQDAWRRAKRRPPGHRAAVPPNESWARFDWSFVHGLGITLIARDLSEEDLCGFGAHLVRSGANVVVGLLVVDDRKLPTVNSYIFRPEMSARQYGRL